LRSRCPLRATTRCSARYNGLNGAKVVKTMNLQLD
jgi:hypothetical protein